MRSFHCEDCGTLTARMWQTGRPLVCFDCGKVRLDVAVTAAHEAVQAHIRACRLELAARTLAERLSAPAMAPAASALASGLAPAAAAVSAAHRGIR